MSGSCREAHPDGLGDPPGCLEVVWRPSRMSRIGSEALTNVWECSGGPAGYPGVVGRPSRMSGSGLETLPNVRK